MGAFVVPLLSSTLCRRLSTVCENKSVRRTRDAPQLTAAARPGTPHPAPSSQTAFPATSARRSTSQCPNTSDAAQMCMPVVSSLACLPKTSPVQSEPTSRQRTTGPEEPPNTKSCVMLCTTGASPAFDAAALPPLPFFFLLLFFPPEAAGADAGAAAAAGDAWLGAAAAAAAASMDEPFSSSLALLCSRMMVRMACSCALKASVRQLLPNELVARTSMSGYAANSFLTTGTALFMTAQCSGKLPVALARWRAPRATNASTISTWPLAHARCSAAQVPAAHQQRAIATVQKLKGHMARRSAADGSVVSRIHF
eukprot:m.17312 g.17312  ORF g.17312 m.17312 type:complete len:311 (+) comp3580_c0_seq1:689-1621(+)